jgi:dTDP-4-dehydrorhamnose reductase
MIALNAGLPRRLAALSQEFDFRLITISTDCVFSGSTGNYREEDVPDPVDIYGKSKLEGEVSEPNCLTLRTSMIGRELDSCHSLVEWLLSHRHGQVKGYVDARFSGFPTISLAKIISLVITEKPHLAGVYHVSSQAISKYDLLNLINDQFEANVRIIPDKSVRIDRSLNSERFWEETGLVPSSWPDMVREMVDDPTPYDEFHHPI